MESRPSSRITTPASNTDVKMVYICGGIYSNNVF